MMSGLQSGLVVVAVVSAGLVACNEAGTRTSPTGVPDARPVTGEQGVVTQSDAEHFGADLDGVEKVTICHIPPGNPDNAHTITVGAPAVPAHLAEHGDSIGPCPEPSPSPTPTPETPPQ